MKNPRGVLLVLLVLLGAALGSAPSFFRKPLTPEGDVGRTMRATLEAVEAGDWQRAETLAERLDEQWNRIRTPIAVNSDATAIRDFEKELATLRAAIRFEDEKAAITALAVMTTIIEDLGTY
ncbi:MAG: DUF4363 domain-containing protein [Bacillota bacterium]|nr:MAG: DUF4363 domain-containing protein [Bacillota bacterium]